MLRRAAWTVAEHALMMRQGRVVLNPPQVRSARAIRSVSLPAVSKSCSAGRRCGGGSTMAVWLWTYWMLCMGR